MEIKDSGERRIFETGAVRDIAEGKGRCDLLPLDCVGRFFKKFDSMTWIKCRESKTCSDILESLEKIKWNKADAEKEIISAIESFIDAAFKKFGHAFIELSKHYEEGSLKYSEYNWTRGIPAHCYVDSCVRHLLKWYDGWDDEPHDRAVLWNLFGLWWTLKNKPECNDLPYTKIKQEEENHE